MYSLKNVEFLVHYPEQRDVQAAIPDRMNPEQLLEYIKRLLSEEVDIIGFTVNAEMT